MNKNAKAVMPKLRFPEFEGNSEWLITVLRSISTPIEKRAGTKKYTLMSVTSGVGLVSQLEKYGREIAGSAYKNYIVIQRGDFAYNKSATKLFPEGYIAMLTDYYEAALPNSIFTCFRITDNQVCASFFNHVFQSNYHGSWLRKFIAVGARAHGSLNVDDKHLWDLPVAIPKLPEQQKIADCLSSLDDLIAAENEKLEALKMHKKGLMQKLFPAEGKTVPQVRFEGYTDAWKQQKYSNAINLLSGQDFEPSDYNELGSGTPYLTGASCIVKGETIVNRWTTKPRCIAFKGDVLLVCKGSGYGTVAILAQDKAHIARQFMALQNLSNLDNTFNYFLAISVVDNIKRDARGLIVGITRNAVLQQDVMIPSMAEQTAIGTFFRNLDELITAQAKKIETLKLHKKALMQGLFPSAQEIME